MRFGNLVHMFQSKLLFVSLKILCHFTVLHGATFQYPVQCGASDCAICTVWVSNMVSYVMEERKLQLFRNKYFRNVFGQVE
jgi:hypothetical protein